MFYKKAFTALLQERDALLQSELQAINDKPGARSKRRSEPVSGLFKRSL